MNQQQKKNRRTIMVIFAMSIIPFMIAWYLARHWEGQGTNNGQLINPPLVTKKDDFIGFDTFSRQNIQQLAGHWVLLNVLPNDDCPTVCLDALHKTKQLRLMMNKDLTRIRRSVIVMSTVDIELAQRWWKEDVRLLRVKPSPLLHHQLKQLDSGVIPDGTLLLMDPLGNIMMRYESGFDPYAVKRDLQKLLRISQIG